MRKKRIVLLSAVLALNDFMMCNDRDGKTMPKGTFFSGGQRQRGDKKMKKSIGKTIASLMVVIAFLMPLMGNTALASEATYHFNSYNALMEEWETDPADMADGDPDDYASTTIDGDVELLTGNTCPGTDLGTITKVEIQARGYYHLSGNDADIILRAVFGGRDGTDHTFEAGSYPDDSDWFEITGELGRSWTWSDVVNLDCDVVADGSDFTLYCSIVRIRVTY